MHSASGRHTLAGLPSEYALVEVATAPPRKAQSEVYAKIDGYVATFARQYDERPDIKSLYLYSAEPGTGKTTTAAALLNAYLRAHFVGAVKRGLPAKKRPAFWLDVNAWQTLYNRANRGGSPDHIREPAAATYYKWLDHASSADFAVLDDIGVRGATPAFRGDLHDVINDRLTNGRPTVYTSNIALHELETLYDARLADRIRDKTAELPFKGGSKRGMRR